MDSLRPAAEVIRHVSQDRYVRFVFCTSLKCVAIMVIVHTTYSAHLALSEYSAERTREVAQQTLTSSTLAAIFDGIAMRVVPVRLRALLLGVQNVAVQDWPVWTRTSWVPAQSIRDTALAILNI